MYSTVWKVYDPMELLGHLVLRDGASDWNLKEPDNCGPFFEGNTNSVVCKTQIYSIISVINRIYD